MALKLMYITNNPEIAKIAENCGVDRIFIDMEFIGKGFRQGGMDTVQNFHTIQDIVLVKNAIKKSQLMVRINPIHEESKEYVSSEEEINAAINAGADLIMLPYFQTAEEVEKCIQIVNGRAKVFPLLESKKAYEIIDEILDIPGIDEIHIGLNDLSLDFGKKFMFELLSDGTVESLCKKIMSKGIPYGFGGVGRLGKGDVPAEYIIKEHYRLGSTCAILSRSFCNVNFMTEKKDLNKIFCEGIREIRQLETVCMSESMDYFNKNKVQLYEKIEQVVRNR